MEFPLFETLAIEHGNVLNIERHQQRYERSLQAFYGDKSPYFCWRFCKNTRTFYIEKAKFS